VEDPGLSGCRHCFRAVGAKVRPFRWMRKAGFWSGPDTLDPRQADLRDAAHSSRCGGTMSLRRRLAWLDWARRSRTLIFEDDTTAISLPGRPSGMQDWIVRARSSKRAPSTKFCFPRFASPIWWCRPAWWTVCGGAVGQHAHAPLLDQPRSATSSPKDTSRGTSDACANCMRNGCRSFWRVPLTPAGLLDIPHVEAGLQTVGWLAQGVCAERAAEEAQKHE